MSFAQGRHLTALLEHHFKALLRRQRRQIIQLELDFHTLVVGACFQDRHNLYLAREHHVTAAHEVHSTALPPPRQAPGQASQEAGRLRLSVDGIAYFQALAAETGKKKPNVISDKP